MKKEYDFSKAERARFYRSDAKLNLPIYLEPKVRAWLGKVAGSVRRCDCGDWMSQRELIRLFRRASMTARLIGEGTNNFRGRLSKFLREYFNEDQK